MSGTVRSTAASSSQTEPISNQPTVQQKNHESLNVQRLDELYPFIGCLCCSMLINTKLPGTIGCGYEGDMLCCDKEGDYCRSRWAWNSNCCCLDCRCAIPTDDKIYPLMISCFFFTFMYQRTYMMEFFKTIGDLKDVLITQDMKTEEAQHDTETTAQSSNTIEVVGHGRAITEVAVPKQASKKEEPNRDDYEKKREEADGVRVAGEEALPVEESKGR